MTHTLVDPLLPGDHPKQMFYHNLCNSKCAAWYSKEGSLDVVVEYVLDLIGLPHDSLQFAKEGFAQTADESFFLTGAAGPLGAVLAVIAFGNRSAALLNDAVQREWNGMLEAMRRGEWTNLPGNNNLAVIKHGIADSSVRGGPEVLGIINQAEIVDLGSMFGHNLPASSSNVDAAKLLRASENAGFSRDEVEYLLQHDNDVVSFERKGGPTALWIVSYSVEGKPPVELMIDNGINEIYLQIFVLIDSDHIVEALSSIGPYAVVGIALIEKLGLMMRSSFFIEHATMLAFNNCCRAVALAYLDYQEAIRR